MDWVRLAQAAQQGDEEAGARLVAELRRAGFAKPERNMEAERYLWDRLGPRSIHDATLATVLLHLKDGRCFSVHLTADPSTCEYITCPDGNPYTRFESSDDPFSRQTSYGGKVFKRMRVWGEKPPPPRESWGDSLKLNGGYFGPWFEYFEE